MKTYNVEAAVGTVYATVEADDEDEAINAAIRQWDEEAIDIFAAATFEARESND